MERYIDLTPKDKKYLQEVFEVSKGMVSDSLNYKVNTDLARKIRHTAVSQLGGRVKVRFPIEETIHCHPFLILYANFPLFSLMVKLQIKHIRLNCNGVHSVLHHIFTIF